MAKTITIEIPDEIEQAITDMGQDPETYFNQQLSSLVDKYREGLKNQAIADSATTITENVETVQAAITIEVV